MPWRPEWQDLAHLFEASDNPGLPLAEHGAGLGPGGVDVGDVEGMGELPLGAATGMRDEIDLGEAWGGDVPVVRLDRDLVLQESSGLGAAVDAAAKPPLEGP